MNDSTLQAELSLSEGAVRRIGDLLSGESEGTALRISVSGGGCSGFQYGFDLDRQIGEDDIMVTRGRARVLVDRVSLQYLRGSEIDFVDDLIGQSFQVKNPQATASCGCGTSFSL